MKEKDKRDIDIKTNEAVVKATVPDGGWGWVVCLACLVGWMVVGGISMSYGIILPSLKKHFRQNTVVISLVGSVLMGVCGFTGPIVASLTDRFGLRAIYMAGSALTGTSLIASTFSPDAYSLLVLYGICAGIGIGLIMLPVSVACNYYFDKRRALATGISKTGVSIGSFVLPPIADYLLEMYGWNEVVYCFAGLAFVSGIFGSYIRPLELTEVKKDGIKEDLLIDCDNIKQQTSSLKSNTEEKVSANTIMSRRRSSLAQIQGYVGENNKGTTEFVFKPKQRRGSRIFLPPLAKSNTFYDGSIGNATEQEQENKGEKLAGCSEKPKAIDRRMSVIDSSVIFAIPDVKSSKKTSFYNRIFSQLDVDFWKDPAMIAFLVSRFFGNFSIAMFYIFLPVILVEHQFTMSQASLMFTAIGIPNMFSRVIVGAMMDHPKICALFLNAIGFTICSGILCVFAFNDNYIVLMVLGGLVGVTFSPYQVNTSIALGEMLPTEKVASGSGKSSFVMGVASISGPVLAGYIYDNSQDHKIIVFVEAIGLFLSGIACLVSSCINSRRKKSSQPNPTEA